MQHHLELLSPAKDLACGLAAINHGADAVYIGPPRFGARAAAGNSLKIIEQLVRHAHTFGARVYIALNTLLDDSELEDAVSLAHKLYELGADALIIQDMGLLESDLPPIALHASTQTNNRTVEKVHFLEQVGFQQVVLARELGLKQIQEISAATSVNLECFIHGALCVSYSGRCYISEVVSDRSANRGECAQFCRHRFTLKDADGRTLEKDRYLLSLKDLNLSKHLHSLVSAGIRSFKIEGRLKDINYVKNVTAYYRRQLDMLIDADSTLQRSSAGRCSFSFTPDPAKTFQRGSTDYFLSNPENKPGSTATPKSMGEKVGEVVQAEKKTFTLKTSAQLHNGDGLCYFDASGLLVGLKANRVEGKRVFHRQSHSPPIGTVIYRNNDVEFAKILQKSEQCRILAVHAEVSETASGIRCLLTDDEGFASETAMKCSKEEAANPGRIIDMIRRQMMKSGGSVFKVKSVAVQVEPLHFLPTSVVNELRRRAFSSHLLARLESYSNLGYALEPNTVAWPSTSFEYLENSRNTKAAAFFRRHGVTDAGRRSQWAVDEADTPLMKCKYCIKRQLGICPQVNTGVPELVEPLSLTDNTGIYELEFDCELCQMGVKKQHKKR